METLQSSSEAAASERIEGRAPEAGIVTSRYSAPSTISLNESIVRDDDDDLVPAQTSRPQHDDSYPVYEQLLKAIAARNPSRVQKRRKGTNTLSLQSVLVRVFRIYYLYSFRLTLTRINGPKVFEIRVNGG